ncbi:hypothetical protein AMC75_02895 [Staphylococcus carnosus]|uniref:YfhO family protein n=1 Tax=Staphylococcus carnosus TaxID=1281 RepID=UPI0006ABB3D4|nr:YfhO family protein [Staphylococcus carnosus]KOR13847.1 hypothetical protein AMC75_02895 [Staphylococcus carnosus]
MKSSLSNKLIRFLKIAGVSVVLILIFFLPAFNAVFRHHFVYSGEGDGFRQMMPFQMYLYNHITNLSSFYDISFGLGGDYMKDLAYYYSTSPLTYVNFFFVWIAEHALHMNPHTIEFWLGNQLFFSIFKACLTFIAAYYLMRYYHLKRYTAVIASMLYAASNVMFYFNFTWSFYGDVLIYFPITLLGVEKLFRERKAGTLIFGLSLTLISNFYFSYYEAIIISAYFIYRTIFTYKNDIMTRWAKIYTTIISLVISLLISIWGFTNGVTSFLQNDRKQNPVEYPFFVNLFDTEKQTFLSGFHIVLSLLVIIALLQFKLYKHYYFRLFAIMTWIFLIGSFTNGFDSFFNGMSIPQRRWVYMLALSAAIITALMIQHLSELSITSLLAASLPAIGIFLYSYHFAIGKWHWWMSTVLIFILMIALVLLLRGKQNFWIKILLVSLFILQQLWLAWDYNNNILFQYQTDQKQVTKYDYFSHPLNKKIKEIQKKNNNDLMRIDYMSIFGLNSPLIYGYNGISLYSSIFDGNILKYYDKTMQINMPIDKNSTYRLFNNRANMMALWNVTDRFKMGSDMNMPYGFKLQDKVKDGKDGNFLHSSNQIHYPSAHITTKTYSMKQLKSPLDREQAMLQGVVWDGAKKGNSKFKNNPNLLSDTTSHLNQAKQLDKNHIKVTKNRGGMTLQLPSSIADKYKDMYVEMDIERLSPSGEHYVKVNEYQQKRNRLDYKYRRFVSPVTMRVKASPDLNIQLPKGKYRLSVKGIYGENYQTLKQASHEVTPVKVKKVNSGLEITKPKSAHGYLVLPTAYRNGLYAEINDKKYDVKKANGIMSVIPVKSGQTHISLKYEQPFFKTFMVITFIGIIIAIIWARWLKRKSFKNK